MNTGRNKNRVPRGLIWAYRVITVISAVIVAAYLLWQVLVPEPAMADSVPPPDPGFTKVELDPSGENGGVDEVDLYERREDCWTFLLVGKDKVGANTDSLMCVNYNVDTQQVSVVSIPRDTRVDVERKNKKINAAYGQGGMEQLKAEVSGILGIPIDYYIKVDVNAFVALIDEVGGIDFYVPCDMDYDDPWQDLAIHYKEGMQHLNGQQALEVCRFRHNNPDIDRPNYGDEGRMETQRKLMTAVARKVLSWDSVSRINEFIGIMQENVETDLSLSNMVWFGSQALQFDMEGLNTTTLPSQWTSPYMYLDPDGVLDTVNRYLNPYTTDRTADQLNIVTR